MSTKYINKQSHASTLALGWRLADDVVEFNRFGVLGVFIYSAISFYLLWI
jgi:hypothetical protein